MHLTASTALILLAVLLPGMMMRGDSFHAYLVTQAVRDFRGAGFTVMTESPQRLGNQTVFIDIVAYRRHGSAPQIIACEVETTPRNVLRNARKIQRLELPLLIVVPSRTVRLAVLRLLQPAGSSRICVLLPSELSQALTDCFSGIPAANGQGETGKQIAEPLAGESASCA